MYFILVVGWCMSCYRHLCKIWNCNIFWFLWQCLEWSCILLHYCGGNYVHLGFHWMYRSIEGEHMFTEVCKYPPVSCETSLSVKAFQSFKFIAWSNWCTLFKCSWQMWDLDKSIVLLYFSFPLHLEWYFSCKFCLVFLCLCSRERYDPMIQTCFISINTGIIIRLFSLLLSSSDNFFILYILVWRSRQRQTARDGHQLSW